MFPFENTSVSARPPPWGVVQTGNIRDLKIKIDQLVVTLRRSIIDDFLLIPGYLDSLRRRESHDIGPPPWGVVQIGNVRDLKINIDQVVVNFQASSIDDFVLIPWCLDSLRRRGSHDMVWTDLRH